MKSKILLGTLALSLVGCSLFGKKSNHPVPEADIRDVPVQAREEEEAPRHRVLVLPFLDERADRTQGAPEAARQVMLRELAKTRQFVLVSPEDFPKDLKKFITEDQDYDMPAIAKVAAGMGVAAVIEGKILDIKARRLGDTVGLIRKAKAEVESQVRLRMFAGKNGKEILNEVRKAEIETSVTRFGRNNEFASHMGEDPDLVRQSVRKAFLTSIPNIVRAVEKLRWEGRIAMVSGERIFVNAGRLSGLQVGDILKVTEEGDDIYDPESGRFIGTAPGRLKGTVEVVSYFGKDGAVAVVHSGSGFRENDRVELY